MAVEEPTKEEPTTCHNCPHPIFLHDKGGCLKVGCKCLEIF